MKVELTSPAYRFKDLRRLVSGYTRPEAMLPKFDADLSIILNVQSNAIKH
jgi:hypothetical protein